MKITKDEARILANALDQNKYELAQNLHTRDDARKLIGSLELLQYRLEAFGVDQRRQGRKSHNDFSDLLKRYSKNYDL